jgi:hypothetical protein
MVKLQLYDYYTENWLESRLQNFFINREKSALELLKEYHPSFRSFLERYPEYFRIEETEDLRYSIIPNRPLMMEWMGYNMTTVGNSTATTIHTTEETTLHPSSPSTSSIHMIKEIMNATEKTLEAGQKFLVTQKQSSIHDEAMLPSTQDMTNISLSDPPSSPSEKRASHDRVVVPLNVTTSIPILNTIQEYQRYLQQTEIYYDQYLSLIRSVIGKYCTHNS